MEQALLSWAAQHHTKITATEEVLAQQKQTPQNGIMIGFWDEKEYELDTGKNFDSLVPDGAPQR